MKIFFSMRHSGALRNYSSTIEELARRGHRIHLTFMMRDKLADPRLLEALTGRYPHITHEAAEVSKRAWLGMARATRSTADYLRYRTPDTAMRRRCTSVPRRECRPPCRRFRGFRLCAREPG